MSHLTSGTVVLKDIAALTDAVRESGCQIEQRKTFVAYTQGQCEYAIKLPGVRYEIGVVKQKDGSFTLAYDPYTYESHGHDGKKLTDKFGDKLCLLQQCYNKHAVIRQARAKGMIVRQSAGNDGSIRLQLMTA